MPNYDLHKLHTEYGTKNIRVLLSRLIKKNPVFANGGPLTPALLAKAEYVNQEYFGYPAVNKLNGGRFNGLMLEGVVAF